MNVQKKNVKLEGEIIMSELEYLIKNYEESFEDCYIWFNDELIEFKAFMDCYKYMNIAKVFVENENYYILENDGIYHIVSTTNPEEE